MVTEYFILNSKLKNSQPDFNCFDNPFETKNKIDKVFLNENTKWTESSSSNGFFLRASYKTELAYIKIEILKLKRSLPYIFQLTVLGGEHPLNEVARLCKLNSWNAYDAKKAVYLNLENSPKIEVSSSDIKEYNDDFWDKMNAAQQEQIEKSIQEEERNLKIQSTKKWWKFW